MSLSKQDIDEFSGYLRNCTDAQVQGVYDREMDASPPRPQYANLAIAEAMRRKITIQTRTG